ncbi:hypothetical protein [Actinoallomurus iriomotensis]|uniref:Uncharacterized protein n=1 Tax=Actinoallomurus iriomotensis TaxID=478107 RepID=A0A9W6RNJ7_9ACTN|nr:hypothetical protein [Actinoallomurus iriomotensis]GLY78918.1 hypothetical protein Airi01_071850 [Actinoallomurus iriomotensis]
MGPTPTRVTLYARATEAERVAEFRWSPESGVSLTVFDPEWGALARDYYENGVPLIRENRRVPAGEGAAFMRALLERRNMSYYSLVDESQRDNLN